MSEFFVRIERRSSRRSQRGSVTGLICLDFGNRQFPNAKWSDFVVVVLGWWLDAIEKAEDSIVLRFMDGPYLLRGHHTDGENFSFDCIEDRRTERVLSTFLVRLPNLRAEIEKAACEVLAVCNEQGWASSDIDRLRQSIGSE
jgi:hypothetical protein